MPDVFDRYSLRRIVNVSGTETVKARARSAPR